MEVGGWTGRRREREKEVGGTQGRGSSMRGQRGGGVREKGTLHRRSVALPSYKNQKPKVAQTHTWDSSKQRTPSSLPLNTFTNTPTTLNQTHVQYFQLKKKFFNTMSTLPSSKKKPKRHSAVHNLLSHQPFLVLTLSPFSLTYDPNTHRFMCSCTLSFPRTMSAKMLISR